MLYVVEINAKNEQPKYIKRYNINDMSCETSTDIKNARLFNNKNEAKSCISIMRKMGWALNYKVKERE